MESNENDVRQYNMKDITRILEIIILAESHEKLIYEVSRYCNSKEDDLFQIFNFILTAKSTEDMQMKVVRFLCSRLPLLLSILGKIPFNRSKFTIKDNFFNHIGSYHEGLSNYVLKTFDDEKNEFGIHECSQKHSSEKTNEKEGKKNKKRRKSKYCEIEGDLSHIQREPKRSKGRNQHESACEKDENKKQEENSKSKEDLTKVHSMIETLTERSCEKSRKDVLEILRSDSELRHLFMKEKARLGVRNIPITLPSKVQPTNCRGQKVENSSSFSQTIVEIGKDIEISRKYNEMPETIALLDVNEQDVNTCSYNHFMHQEETYQISPSILPSTSPYTAYDCQQSVSHDATDMFESNSLSGNFSTTSPTCMYSYNDAVMSTQMSDGQFQAYWEVQYEAEATDNNDPQRHFTS